MPENDVISNIYTYLRSKPGLGDLPTTENDFRTGLNDPSVAENVFNYLKGQKDIGDLPGTFTDFYNNLGLKKKEYGTKDIGLGSKARSERVDLDLASPEEPVPPSSSQSTGQTSELNGGNRNQFIDNLGVELKQAFTKVPNPVQTPLDQYISDKMQAGAQGINHPVAPQETSYGEGFLKAVDKGWSDMFRTADNAAKFLDSLLGYKRKEGDKGLFDQLAGYFENRSANWEDVPEGFWGDVAKGGGSFIPLLGELALTPELRAAKIGSMTLQLAPKFATLEGTKGFFNAYQNAKETGKNPMLEGYKGLGMGYAEGLFLHNLGVGSNQVGELVGDALKNKVVGSAAGALANGLGFGGFDAASQYFQTGKVDFGQVASNATLGTLMSFPNVITGFAKQKALTNFFSASPQTIKAVNEMQFDPMKLRDESIKLGEQAEKETNPDAKNALLTKKVMLDNVLDINASTQYVLANKDNLVKDIKNNKQYSDQEKDFLINKIDDVSSEAKSKPIEPEKTEAKVEPTTSTTEGENVEKTAPNEEPHPKNNMIYEGKPTFMLLADKNTGEILDKVSYEQYEEAGKSHTGYLRTGIGGDIVRVMMDSKGDIDAMEGPLSSRVKRSIKSRVQQREIPMETKSEEARISEEVVPKTEPTEQIPEFKDADYALSGFNKAIKEERPAEAKAIFDQWEKQWEDAGEDVNALKNQINELETKKGETENGKESEIRERGALQEGGRVSPEIGSEEPSSSGGSRRAEEIRGKENEPNGGSRTKKSGKEKIGEEANGPISFKKPGAVDVRQSPGNGKEVAGGNAEGEEAAGKGSKEKEVQPKEEETGVTWKGKRYGTIDDVSAAYQAGTLNFKEHNEVKELLRHQELKQATANFADKLEKAFTKRAVGEEGANYKELFDALVQLIKANLEYWGPKIGNSAKEFAKFRKIEYNQTLQDAWDVAKGTTTKSTQRIMEAGDKMRGFAKRVKDFEKFEGLREEISANPELWYKAQSIEAGWDAVNKMSSEELKDTASYLSRFADIPTEMNIGVLAYMKLIDRTRAEGGDWMKYFEDLNKAGTSLGQLVRQFAEWKGQVSPETMLAILEKILEKSGRYLSTKERTRLTKLIDDDITARTKVKHHEEIAQLSFTPDNIKAWKNAKKEGEDAFRKYSQYLQSLMPRSLGDQLELAVQGNLLTPMSLLSNVYGNALLQPLIQPTYMVASAMDWTRSVASGKPRDVFWGPGRIVEGLKGAVGGAKESAIKVIKGPTSEDIKATTELTNQFARGFRPITAWKQMITGDGMAKTLKHKVEIIPTTDGKYAVKYGNKILANGTGDKSYTRTEAVEIRQKLVDTKGRRAMMDMINKAVEGTIGAEAEIMLRGLVPGDLPFYRGIERAEAWEIAKLRNLNGQEKERLMTFPDAEARKVMEAAAQRGTFQEQNSIAAAMGQWQRNIKNKPIYGPVLGFMMRLITPFVKTPTNILERTADYAIPIIPAVRGFGKMYKGDIRGAELDIATAIVGTVVTTSALALAKHGITTPTSDKDKRVRDLMYDTQAPNTFNVDGFKRLLNGEDPTWKNGDETIALSKMGIIGSVMGVWANVTVTTEKIAHGEGGVVDDGLQLMGAALELPAFMFDQSFAKGIGSFFDAIQTRSWDNWAVQFASTGMAVAIPNTWSAVNRANMKYLPDTWSPSFGERLINVLKTKTWGWDSVPSKLNLWGQPVVATPEGENPYTYQLIDVTKGHKTGGNVISNMLLNMYEKTEDASIIPTPPDENYTYRNVKFTLSSDDLHTLRQMVGQKRLEYMYKNYNELLTKDLETASAYIRAYYEAGLKAGKLEFEKRMKQKGTFR